MNGEHPLLKHSGNQCVELCVVPDTHHRAVHCHFRLGGGRRDPEHCACSIGHRCELQGSHTAWEAPSAGTQRFLSWKKHSGTSRRSLHRRSALSSPLSASYCSVGLSVRRVWPSPSSVGCAQLLSRPIVLCGGCPAPRSTQLQFVVLHGRDISSVRAEGFSCLTARQRVPEVSTVGWNPATLCRGWTTPTRTRLSC